MVTATKASGASASARNWKWVAERDRQAEARAGRRRALLVAQRRQTSPRPATKYQISSTVRCGDGVRDGAGGQFEMGETAARERGEQPHRRAVGRDRIGTWAQELGGEGGHGAAGSSAGDKWPPECFAARLARKAFAARRSPAMKRP